MRVILYILFGFGGVLVALALGVVFFGDDETVEVAPQTQSIDLSIKPVDALIDGVGDDTVVPQPEATASASPTPDPQSSAGSALIIDIARVKPDGAAVVAGSAPPKAVISVFEDKILLGRTIANENGEWVVVLEKRLGPGQHLISIAAEPENAELIMGETSIAIEIYADQSTKPLVALLPQNRTQMPVLLQSPDAGTRKTTADAVSTSTMAQIGPRSLVWRDKNKLSIGGNSRGGVRVTVSVNGTFFGEALVLADGSWQVSGEVDQNRNFYDFEFVLVDNAGQVAARYILPVQAHDLEKGMDGSQLVIVNKGDALWRIAYRSYGKGLRYVDIVRKNTGDIDDPDLIYPNQIFALPETGAAN